jgi:hypothetical protein
MVGEFFAARADDIDSLLIANGTYGRFSTVEANGLTEVSIATLGEILGAGSYDSLVERASEGPAAQGSEADDGDTGRIDHPQGDA